MNVTVQNTVTVKVEFTDPERATLRRALRLIRQGTYQLTTDERGALAELEEGLSV